MDKRILIKALRLQKLFSCYNGIDNNGSQKKQVYDKFKDTWGIDMANHFLNKYNDAESLIWAFDTTNLNLFITKF